MAKYPVLITTRVSINNGHTVALSSVVFEASTPEEADYAISALVGECTLTTKTKYTCVKLYRDPNVNSTGEH